MQDDHRDIATDITAIREQLGEPDAMYQSNARAMLWRLAIGVTIVIAAAVLHYFVWTGGIPAFQIRHVKFWIFVILAMFVGPGTGLYLIYFAVRGMKLWVLEYPTGLFVWHRGTVYALPWNEIASVTFKGLPSKATFKHTVAHDGLVTAASFDLSRSTRRLFGTVLVLTRNDGTDVTLYSLLNDFPTLSEHIQQQTCTRQFPNIWEMFQANELLQFGVVFCNTREVLISDQAVRWREIASIERLKGRYNIKLRKKNKIWGSFEIDKVPNLHLFMGLAHAMIAQYDDAAET